MNLNSLFKHQKRLDARIIEEHNLEDKDVSVEKLVALSVELGEFKNELPETFKFWSKKKNNYEKALVEYVDCIHFAISVANDLGYEKHTYVSTEPRDLNRLYLGLQDIITTLSVSEAARHIEALMNNLILLGYQTSFTEKQVIEAYHKKHAINHKRQDNKY